MTATTAAGGPAGFSTMTTVVEAGCSGATVLTIGSTGAGGSLAHPSSTVNISTNTNNLALSSSAFQRLNCTNASQLTGIAPPNGSAHADGRMIRIVNVGTDTVTIKHMSTSSDAANRIDTTGTDKTLTSKHALEVIYDSTAGNWLAWELT
jgi:hypothetical protein